MKDFVWNKSTNNCASGADSCTGIYSENAITIIPDQKLSGYGSSSSQSVQFARQIAALKSLQAYRDPFYVMDMPKVAELVDLWVDSLPRVQPYYAVGCNNNPVLLKMLASNGVFGFSCKTTQDLEDALQHVNADKILFGNPVWTRASLRKSLEKDVQLITFDSVRDFDRIMLHHPNAELMLHIAVDTDSEDPAVSMGCDINEAPEILEYAANYGANLTGISFNLGSGCATHSLYASAIKMAAQLFEIGCRLGLRMRRLNLGAGFSHLDKNFPEICNFINESLDYYFPLETYGGNLQIMATPGRFFAGSVFSLATNIIGRRSVDLSHITNDDFDAGREAFVYSTNEGFYGGFGCRLNANIEPACVPLFDHFLDNISAEHVYGTVIGPTLDDMDVVQSMCRFRLLSEGDWLMWENMGAYSMNNRGSLDDADQDDGQANESSPKIFYFTSQSQWDRLSETSASPPASPTPSDYCGSSEDDRVSTMSCQSSDSLLDQESGYAYDDEDDEAHSMFDPSQENQDKFLAMFGWSLYD